MGTPLTQVLYRLWARAGATVAGISSANVAAQLAVLAARSIVMEAY
jgi:hypothetical protein